MRQIRILALTCIMLGLTVFADACEICGCGVGNFYLGMLPNFKNKFVGVRYHFMQYKTRLKTDESQFSNDYYKTVEIWSGWNIGKRWQVMAFVPYQINKQNTDDGKKQQSGLGDITLLSNYKLWQHRSEGSDNNLRKQELWLGAGIKLPTGKYQLDLNNPDANIGDVNSQMGTGSVDFMINATHNLMLGRFGMSSSANYKMNTTNSDHYRFGNRFMLTSIGYYHFKVAGLDVSPNVGGLYQTSAINHYNDTAVAQTGGWSLFVSGGVEIGIKRVSLGASVFAPVAQDYAEGQTEAKLRGLLHVSYSF